MQHSPPNPYLTNHPAGQAKPEGVSFDPWLIWVTVRRCWFWALPLGCVLAALASVYVLYTFVPQYKATHLLEADQTYLIDSKARFQLRDLAKSQTQFIRSPRVLRQVWENESLRGAPSLSNPETAQVSLLQNLRIQPTGSPSQMWICYQDSDPQWAADVCNAVASSFLDMREKMDNERNTRLIRQLEIQITDARAELGRRDEAVTKQERLVLGFNPRNQLDSIQGAQEREIYTALRKEVYQLQVEIQLAEEDRARNRAVNKAMIQGAERSDEEILEDFVAEPVPMPSFEVTKELVDAEIEQNEEIVDLRSRIADARRQINRLDLEGVSARISYYNQLTEKKAEYESKIEVLSNALREDARATVAKRLERSKEVFLAELERSEEKAKQNFVAATRLAIAERRQDSRVAKETADSEQLQKIASLQLRLDIAQKQLDNEREKLGDLSEDVSYLETLRVRRDQMFEKLGFLEARLDSIIAENRDRRTVYSISPAEPPRSQMEQLPFKKMVVMGGGAFAIPFLIGLLWEFRVQRLTDANAVEKQLAVAPVLGELSKAPTSDRNRRERRIFEESVDNLRANIFLSAKTKNARSIAIVSSMSGEGKSTAASQLAISLAKASRKTVLLIDADLRCPDQHDIFGIDLSPGLSGVLSGKATLDEAIDDKIGDLIHVLPAGELTHSPHRLLGRDAVEKLVNEALEKYEFVILDTAPVLAASETLAVAAVADTTLVCAMRDKTRVDAINRTCKRLEAAEARVSGTIFSGVSARQYAYRYGDYEYAAGFPDSFASSESVEA